MSEVPPEIEKLHDLAFDVTEEGWESCSATSCVSVEHAEAAVLACEQRMRSSTPGEQWVPRSMLVLERQRTVAEIVEWLRTTKGDEWMRGQDAARMIESRFGGGES